MVVEMLVISMWLIVDVYVVEYLYFKLLVGIFF